MSIYDGTNSLPLIVTFNSKDRISGSNTSFNSTPVDLGSNLYDSVCLTNASVPKSWFNVPNGTNSFILKEQAQLITITIPIGSYTRNSLMPVLASLLTTNSFYGYTYTCTYPNISTQADTYSYTFHVSGNGIIQPTFIFGTSSPFQQLGFSQLSSNDFVANQLVSTNAINLQYVLRLYIQSNIVSGAYNGILQELLNVGSFPPLSVIYYQQYNFDVTCKSLNRNSNNSWNFTLVDEYLNEVDLRGIPWAFTLVFFQRNNTHEIQKQDLMISNEQRMFEIQQQQDKLSQDVLNGPKMEIDYPLEPHHEPIPEIHYPL